MSLFRKPKKIQRRVFCADDDEEDEGPPAEPLAPPPPVISKKKEKTNKKTSLLSFADEVEFGRPPAKKFKKFPLLSFADEEEDGEVFKVKKSKQSNKLSKKRDKDKDRRRAPEGDNNHNDNNVDEEAPPPPNITNNEPKKKISLEGLILSGREALAADGAGDISSGDEGEDSRGFHQYRAESVRAAIAQPGHIPDAALIHAARKTRQQAREHGADFIPVTNESGPGSRLVRDEDDDEDEGRIQVRGLELPSDKPNRGTAAEPANDELDSEPDEWEEQQIKKAMPAIADVTGIVGDTGIVLNPFTLTPAPAPLEVPPHLRPLQPPPANVGQLVSALRIRLQELNMARQATVERKEKIKERLLSASRIKESRSSRCGTLDAAYRRAQAARGYITDLVECLDEKMPGLEALEARALALHRRRCEFLMERRRADVRDQAHDVLSLAARTGSTKQPDSEDKIRRTAEREGRRRARRLAREAANAAHRDGDSSDDELPPKETQQLISERESIRAASAALFLDALPAWRSVRGVVSRLARWRRLQPALYTQAYVAHCLPRLIAPYVRHQLVLWNPLADEDNEDHERMDWFRCLMMYGVKAERPSSDSEGSEEEMEDLPLDEEAVREDSDLMLVPAIISKVLLPKVAELVENAWDPMCVRACIRLRQLVVRTATTPGAAPALAKLADAIKGRLSQALGADVYLPALPPHIMDSSGGAFWRRCLGSGVRLLRAALSLTAPPDILHADPIVLKLIDTLCMGAGAAPAQYSASACVALGETLPRSGPLRAAAIKRLASLAQLALSRKDSYNPLHIKALEQARCIIAEAKALE